MAPPTVFVTGANGYIGNAVARAFVRAGWITYGLVRSQSSCAALAVEEIIPIVGSIDDTSSYDSILNAIPTALNAIVSTTEALSDYVPHFNHTLSLLRTLADATVKTGGSKPLVIFTSGCKDYGVGPHYDGEPGLTPHTEDLPINPPPLLALRAQNATKIFDHTDLFRPVLVRPTNVYGRSASYYAGFFLLAEAAVRTASSVVLPSKPNAVLCALHVDDCGDAYVAIASHMKLESVEGQIFNISPRRYETVKEVTTALLKEYDIKADPEYVSPEEWQPRDQPWLAMLVGFPQWTDSTKLRNLTGWTDHRPLFAETIGIYRKAFEAADELKDPAVRKLKQQIADYRNL